MKQKYFGAGVLLLLSIVLTFNTGCQTRTEQGAALGAALGAGAGALSEGDAKGALVGAVAGGLTGAAIGRYMDEAAKKAAQENKTVIKEDTDRNKKIKAVPIAREGNERIVKVQVIEDGEVVRTEKRREPIS